MICESLSISTDILLNAVIDDLLIREIIIFQIFTGKVFVDQAVDLPTRMKGIQIR